MVSVGADQLGLTHTVRELVLAISSSPWSSLSFLTAGWPGSKSDCTEKQEVKGAGFSRFRSETGTTSFLPQSPEQADAEPKFLLMQEG